MKTTPLVVALPLLLAVANPPLSGQPAGQHSQAVSTAVATNYLFEDAPGHVAQFLETHLGTAMAAGRQLRVPVSIILGLAALESGYGAAPTAVVQQCNNLFSIKTWQEGDPVCCGVFTEGIAEKKEACFRKYSTPQESIWDFCRLMHARRYLPLTFLPRWDYRAWARGLQRSGYATDPFYAEKLIRVIEQYGLQRFDPQPSPHPYWAQERPKLHRVKLPAGKR